MKTGQKVFQTHYNLKLTVVNAEDSDTDNNDQNNDDNADNDDDHDKRSCLQQHKYLDHAPCQMP